MKIEDTSRIAVALVEARRQSLALPGFPGLVPETLDAAYAIQKCAIGLWDDAIAGWKVGRLNPALSARYGVDRFIGPIFARDVQQAQEGAISRFPMIRGGTSAFEAELVVMASQDQPEDVRSWTPETAAGMMGAVHIGIEIAGSSVPGLGDLPTMASIAAFGNNLGQIIGARTSLEAGEGLDAQGVTTSVDGAVVRTASATSLPGGPMAAMAFALAQLQRLGMPLRKGQFVSTGAITGVHDVVEGQQWQAVFHSQGSLSCLAAGH